VTPEEAQATYNDDALLERTRGYTDKIYGHLVAAHDGGVWMQYWVFYYWNGIMFNGAGLHEGDWEMIQVHLPRGGAAPDGVTYATHSNGTRCGWSGVEKYSDGVVSDVPIAWIATNSHASYLHQGSTPLVIPVQQIVQDEHNGGGVQWRPPLEIVTNDTPWMAWPGRWGASTDGLFESPTSPSQHSNWANADEFNTLADQC
jgi:hypothetical protein